MPLVAQAQVRFSNLLQAEVGNIPYTLPLNRTDLYDQANLQATWDALTFGGRLELRENSERVLTYREITQRWGEWKGEHLRGRVGNFYTIVGRGLIHRSFELPGVVLDDPGTRSEFAFTRAVAGALLDGDAGPVAFRVFGGEPTDGTVSPAKDETTARYRGQVVGGQATVEVGRGAQLGAGYLRNSVVDAFAGVDRQDELGTGFVSLDPVALSGLGGVHGLALPLYAEYAQLDRTFAEWWDFAHGAGTPHALYVASNLLAGPLALSAEWKDYQRFRLGTNDPPSLVREHTFALLNRATHVLLADDEHGFQLEGSWSLPAWGALTVNHSRSDGISGLTPRRFVETYLELHGAPARWHAAEATLFFDRGEDTFESISDRKSWGGVTTLRAREVWSLTIDAERSDATRFYAPIARRRPDSFSDRRLAVSVAHADWGSVGVIGETSSDPAIRSDKRPHSDRRFFATTVTARLGARQTATVFVGERRGGRACTAGTCYDVPDFRGVELRLTSRY